MKEVRYIPYGYTIKNGSTVVERSEADVIRFIFERYIKGASLKELADELTRRQIPYTKKSDTWDKARIARIIENARYVGTDEYDPIIAEQMYQEAANAKAARAVRHTRNDSKAIITIRDKVRCAYCGKPMIRHISSRYKIKESWTCSNPECEMKVRIGDTILLQKLTIVINRIISNANLMIPKSNSSKIYSETVHMLQSEISKELLQYNPDDSKIVDIISRIAGQLYSESDASGSVDVQMAKCRVMTMKATEEFNSQYFLEIVDTILLDNEAKISIITKTATKVEENNL